MSKNYEKTEAQANPLWSKQQVKAATEFWTKLSEEEITKSAGNKNKLTDLVEKRYAITHDAANKQVNSFFSKNNR